MREAFIGREKELADLEELYIQESLSESNFLSL